MKTKTFFAALAVLALLGVVCWWYFFSVRDQSPDAIEATGFDTDYPEFSLTAVQLKNNTRRILSCLGKECHTLTAPKSEYAPPVTDGDTWYHYTNLKDKYGDDRLTLLRTAADATYSTTIVEETDLTRPRDLIISPDNKKIAYWLDNVSNRNDDLTELWVYDAEQGGTKLIAEKIYRPDVLNRPTWNRASNLISFVANTAEQGAEEKHELIVATLQPPTVNASFVNVRWEDIVGEKDFDISPDGKTIAHTTSFLGLRRLVVAEQNEDKPDSTHIKGDIVHLGWLKDGSLLYITQNHNKYTVWRQLAGVHRKLTEGSGTVLSGKPDSQQKHLIIATKVGRTAITTAALNLETSATHPLGTLPSFGDHTFLVQATPIGQEQQVAGISTTLEDDQQTAFIQRHLSDIANNDAASPLRVLPTENINTSYVDYRIGDKDYRILITINDILHREWTIGARFESRAGKWVKVQGGGLSDPPPVKLYEWEEDFQQWILKETY